MTSRVFELVPQKLIFGGDALGHHQGRTVLVPNALPGERVEVESLRESKGVVHARVRRVVSPSPARVQAPCPYFGDCGGCSYQHLSYEDQKLWKVEIFRETLRRIGKIAWDSEIAVYSAFPWCYRNQARFKIGNGGGTVAAVGFFASESHRLVKVDTCRILSPCLNATLAGLRNYCLQLLDGITGIDLMADDTDHRVMLRLSGTIQYPRGERLAKAILASSPQVQSVAFQVGGRQIIFGRPFLDYQVGEFKYRISPGSFFQASRFMLPELVRVVATLGSEPGAEAHSSGAAAQDNGGGRTARQPDDVSSLALDLYAGVGLFTLPLSKRFDQVVAVESHSGCAGDLEANARRSGCENIRLVNQPVFKFLRRFAVSEPGLVVLDPPRAGVGFPTLKLLTGLRPKQICYVSCHPPTLARDLSFLVQHGYALTALDVFDLFPQTAHLESVAWLQQTNPIAS